MQTIITLIIVACAVTYAVRRAIKTFKNTDNECDCCEGCGLRQHKTDKRIITKDNGSCRNHIRE